MTYKSWMNCAKHICWSCDVLLLLSWLPVSSNMREKLFTLAVPAVYVVYYIAGCGSVGRICWSISQRCSSMSWPSSVWCRTWMIPALRRRQLLQRWQHIAIAAGNKMGWDTVIVQWSLCYMVVKYGALLLQTWLQRCRAVAKNCVKRGELTQMYLLYSAMCQVMLYFLQ